jgi:LCP family protein required for cell wall assembly
MYHKGFGGIRMLMKRWTIGILACAAIGLAVSAWLIWNLQPDRHFVSKDHPVLAMPSSFEEKIPNDGSSYSFQLFHEQRARQDFASNKPAESYELSKNIQPKDDHAFNTLLLGVDAEGTESSRSDVILLVHVMPAVRKVNVISVPRDTRVKLAGVGETKINHAHAVGQTKGGSKGGTEAVIQAVSDLFQVPIHYYAKTNFTGFQHFIDDVGGVDIDIPQEMWLSESHTHLQPGIRHLDGKRSLSFVRERYSLDNGDFGRQIDQTLLLKAVVQKLVEPERLPELPELIAKVKKDVVETNFSDSDLISLALLFKGILHDQINHVQVPGHSAMLPDPLVGLPLWYWIPDMDEVKNINKQFLQS